MKPSSNKSQESTQRQPRVLLVDDQAIVGEAVRRLLEDQQDIAFRHCQHPFQAISVAEEFQPTVILQDLVMPDIDGLTLVKFFRAHPATRDLPLVVLSTKEEPTIKAEAFGLGANDYIVKLPDKLELVARIRYHSRAYINLLERNEAFAALTASEHRLAAEMQAGAKYVSSLLPAPIQSPVHIDWRYVPCSELGGDALGYFSLDDQRLAFYILDVAGHGLDSALLGVTVSNLLRAQALPNTDFTQPNQVFDALNRSFQMERHGRFFTMWYGVVDRAARKLTWSGAGHPPGLLCSTEIATTQQLESQNPCIGMFDWVEAAEQQVIEIPDSSRLYIYSDGAHEIHKLDGQEWSFDEFLLFMSQPEDPHQNIMDRLIRHIRALKGEDVLDDDFTMLELRV